MAAQERQGTLIAGLAGDEWLRWVAVDVAGPLAEARRRRDLAPIAATALGRALAGVSLLYRHALRTPLRMRLNVQGDGPLGKVVAEISADRFRGRVELPHADNGLFGQRRQRLGEAIGSGRLEVTRETSSGSFLSHSDLVTGEIGSDLAHYLLQSEQTRSVLALGEFLSPDGIQAAGGYLIEALPGIPESVLRRLEENLEAAPSWSRSLYDRGVEEALTEVLSGLDPSTREREPLEYRCGCDRESVLARLQTLPEADRRELERAADLTAECEYCGTEHRFEAGEIALAAAAATAHRGDADIQ